MAASYSTMVAICVSCTNKSAAHACPAGENALNTPFLVALIVEALFGLGLLLAPSPLLGRLDVTLDATATTLARLFGSALIGFAVLLWCARKSDEPEFTKGAAYSLMAYYAVSAALLAMAVLAGLMNATGWGTVGIHVILLIWFGYALAK